LPEVAAERAILVGVGLSGPARSGSRSPEQVVEASLEELSILADSAGATVVDCVSQIRSTLDAATVLGSGKVEEIAAQADAEEADLIIFDGDLTPARQRNLEQALPCKVIDRTQLILDIFARRARTREGQLQVELAQLNYVLPRLTGRGVAMSRLGGGIGTRGPGETQLETDRRKIHRRIRKIGEQLKAVRNTRAVQRRQRQGIPLAGIAMAGYTNAGKSTLFNRLTGAKVATDARMFATLDPTVRLLGLPSRRRAIIGDTVGFIRNLPTTLIKAFSATLEEVTEAALLLHIVDASSPHASEHTAHVLEVLSEIGAAAIPQILVLNKIDCLDDSVDPETVRRRILADRQPAAVAVSARTGQGVKQLLSLVDAMLPVDPVTRATFRLPVEAGLQLHLLHEYARVTHKHYDSDCCIVEAEVPESLRRRLEPYLVPAVSPDS
jgi:GTP-binding protein HflX